MVSSAIRKNMREYVFHSISKLQKKIYILINDIKNLQIKSRNLKDHGMWNLPPPTSTWTCSREPAILTRNCKKWFQRWRQILNSGDDCNLAGANGAITPLLGRAQYSWVRVTMNYDI